jgi:UDP-glucose 4-epimerase
MDFVYVEDVAHANLLATKSPVSDDVINVASGTETSLKQLADALSKVMGVNIPHAYGPARKVNPVARRLADTSKADKLLNFKARFTLEQGLRKLVNWWAKETGNTKFVQGEG